MKKINPKSKRGISLMEVVIAIFIIVLVSLASTTLTLSSIKQEKLYSRNVDIAITAENTIECFNFTNDFDSLLALLKELDAYEKVEDDKIALVKENYFFEIVTDYSANSITVSAYQDLTLIKQFSFCK